MKKFAENILNKNNLKRLVSLITALALLLCSFPIMEIEKKTYKDNAIVTNTASAADNEDATPPANYEFAHNANNEISLSIVDFYSYAKSYQKYPKYHKNDKITINTTSGNTSINYYERNFNSLGTKNNPFSGSISIETGLSIVLNLDAPLFAYVADTVSLNGATGLKISRFYGHKIPSGETKNDTTPLLAENVVTGEGTKATWNISIEKPSATDDTDLDGYLEPFAGMIGTMNENSEITLNVTIDQQIGDTDSIELKSKSNLGLACGLMKEGATLSFSIGSSQNGTLRNISNIVTTSGNVGGLVGEMESGSTFTYTGSNIQESSADIKTSNGYAGGIVGKNNGATVNLPNTTYKMDQYISGTSGSGGIYGYYVPETTEISFDPTYFDTEDSQVNGAGNVGGLFGYFECDHDYTIDFSGTIVSTHASGNATSYGGLIGKYKTNSLSNTFEVANISTNMTRVKDAKVGSYGGAIGIIDDTNASYIKFDNFTLSNAKLTYSDGDQEPTFGGLVGKAENAFIDANNVNVSVNSYFTGGGLVGNLDHGVLRMTGTTDLSGAKSLSPTSNGHKYGQIVGYRDNALIFAEESWKLKRSAAVDADDIGGWGEVLRFDSKDTDTEVDEEDSEISYSLTLEQFSDETVLTVNEDIHMVSIGEFVSDISSIADFAITALNIQLSNSDIVSLEGGSDDIALETSIDLHGTGLTGFTRDNNSDGSLSSSHCIFDGNFDAAGYTITLAIGESYGYRGENDLSEATSRTAGDGRIYNHRFNGLFGILDGSTIGDDSSTSQIVFDGLVSLSPKVNEIYVGAIAGVAKTKIAVYSTNIETEFHFGGSKDLYLGRMIGSVEETTENSANTKAIDIYNCNLIGDVIGSNASGDTCLGGVIGLINHDTNAVQNWYLESITTSGKIENSANKTQQKMGGLIARIEGYKSSSGFKSRTLTLDDIVVSGLEISAGTATSMGGLLGYQWRNTDVIVGAVNKSYAPTETSLEICNDSTLTAQGIVSDMAGLVYNATGKWTVNDLDITSMIVDASNPRSFGMIVNKGWYSDSNNYTTDDTSSAIYLLLPTTGCYKITDATLDSLDDAAVFDELVAYSAYYSDSDGTRVGTDASGNEYILKNGAGVISIKTSVINGIIMDGSAASKSYQAQTTQGAKPNPWSRYYYNLDTVTVASSSTWSSASAQKKLMSWGLNKYAHRSIRAYFYDGFGSNITAGSYDMNGFSWYPVDADINVTIAANSSFKFYNYEFEKSEDGNGGTNSSKKTSLFDDTNNTTTQHYLLHSGLLRNVSSGKTISVNGTTLQGNIGIVGSYSGALICGTVSGTSDLNKSIINIDGLTLDGVYIHNIENVTGNSKTYAPLVINNITKYTNLNIKNVSTTNAYSTSTSVPYIKNDGTYPKAASSLIGTVGSATAKGLNLNFSLIKLDGRIADVGNSAENGALNTAYGTSCSIFTKATLLDKFQFDSGSTGTYNYTWNNDWGTDNRKVTYGEEVGYETEGEYPNKEREYLEGSSTTEDIYTNPIYNSDFTGEYFPTIKSNFLPYVATPYDYNNNTHQLEVNHRTTTAEGCGTYNDPYIINSSSDLENFVNIINGTSYIGKKLILPSAAERATYWCDDKEEGSKHNLYEYGGSTFDCTGQTPLSTTEVRSYLAGAYYQLGKSFELSSNYAGFSNFTTITSDNEFAVFKGVIDGDGYTLTNTSSSPLIVNSYGSVIENMTVNVKPAASISLSQTSTTDKFPTCKSYGAIFGNVLGGDNIIDDVSVTFAEMEQSIVLTGNSQLIPIGGYIGVIVNGAVIFKEMSGKSQGLSTLSDANLTGEITVGSGRNAVTTTYSGIDTDSKFLYVNPIIGRVLNGYAVTESDAYITSEEDVTMNNGTKNYSIADIDKTEKVKLSTGAYEAVSGASTMYSTDVSIPNAQALFIMSLLTQSSTTVGTPGTGALVLGSSDSYDKTYKVMRRATYSDVGTDKTKAEVTDYSNLAVNDNATSGVPYIVTNYTDVIASTTNYGVLALTNNNTVCNFNLGGKATEWILPDAFRGIGTIGFGRNNLTNRSISLHKFSGLLVSESEEEEEQESESTEESDNEVTMILNMSLKHYEYGFDNYLPVNNTFQGGFGLFNTLHHNRSDQGSVDTENYKISNLNITGKVDYFVFKHDSADGSTTYINTYVHNDAYLNTGGIAGYVGFSSADSVIVEKIGVSGLTVNGFETAGGFFGNLQLDNNATNHQATISNIDATSAFTVTSKRYSGGIIGYFKQGNLLIDTVNITLPNVINEYRGNAYQDFQNGAGGVIGFAQTSNNNAPIVLTNVTLGEENNDIISRIGYKEGATFFRSGDGNNSKGDDTVVAGGIIGRCDTIGKKTENGITFSIKLEDCNVYNISIYGHRVGGLIGSDIGGGGDAGTYHSYLAFFNCHVISDNNSVMKGLTDNVTINKLSHRATGGIIGGAKINQIIVDSCSVEGYTLWSYNDTAGVCANIEGTNNAKVYVRNYTIKDVVLKSDYSAALVGWLNKPLQGYNILCDNVQFQDKSGGTNYIAASHGYLVSKNNVNHIKLVGVSLQNTDAKPGYFIPPRLSGTNNYNANGGYVIFADYKGAAAETNNTFANINTGLTNVKDYDGNDVSDNNPYVTSSPKTYIGTNQFLTGDAVSAVSYDDSALSQIIADKKDSNKNQNGAQSYQTAPAVNETLLKNITDHLTSSREEFGIQSMPEFPMLVVEDTDKTKVTNYINYYLQNLTNTTYSFQVDVTNVYMVTMHKCTYNSNTGIFTIGADTTGSLQRYTTGFQMDASKIDNADPSTPQFTLIDIKFLNPADKNQVAYHLYVPIYVKKLIEYKFSAKLVSGTNYYYDAYSATNEGNTLFENLGNPVTMRIEYTYERDEQDWADAINGGENVLEGSNFYKELKLLMDNTGWAPNSRLVLVDTNDNDKHYYLDSINLTPDSNGYHHIAFESFTTAGASGGTAYKPVPMINLLDVQCTESSGGPLVITNDETKATLKIGNTMYMPRPDNNTAQGYSASVTAIRPEVYYLSFFTKNITTNTNVYRYEISSLERFGQHGDNDTNWKPNKIIRGYNKPVRLITGDLYTNEFDNDLGLVVTPLIAQQSEMTKTNNVHTITMTAHVGLTQAAITAGVASNIAQNQNSTIFQTFLINYDMLEAGASGSKIGVETSSVNSITITDYKIYSGTTASGTGTDVKSSCSDPDDLKNSNYIELRNNTNLNEYLHDSENNYAATIQVTFAVEYSSNMNILQKQFPERTDVNQSTIGAKVRGFSNMSSTAESGAYSSSSKLKPDTTLYYTMNAASAKLTYNAKTSINDASGKYSSLGINPFDKGTDTTNIGHIDTTAIYSYVDLMEAGDYIEFSLSLTNKKEGYRREDKKLVLSDYLQNIVIKAGSTTLYAGSDVNNANIKAYLSSDEKTLILRANKIQLVKMADKIYSIDISYDVLTGASNGFGSTKAYSNYMVTLTADIYNSISDTSEPDAAPHAFDHIIYTNSRLQYKFIK